MAGVLYQIPCKAYLKIYMVEAGRRYGAQEKEHKGDVNSLEEIKFTRSRKKDSLTEVHPSSTYRPCGTNQSHHQLG